MENNIYDVIIVGAGAAGLTCALYLKRAGINPLVLEKESPGGTLNKIHVIENYPGYTEERGANLAFKMYSQVENLETEFKIEDIINIKKEENYYKVITNKNEYSARYLVLSSGKMPKKLDIVDAKKYENKGISYCTTCDGALYKNKDVIIVGGGKNAISSIKYMKDIARKIYVVVRASKMREELPDDLKDNNIEIIYNDKINQIIGDDNIEEVILESGLKINASAIFVCIGIESNTAYYQNLNLESDSKGLLVDNNMKTSDDFIYACGDIISKDLYQVVTATSEGAIAANNIIKKLKNML